MNFNSVIGKSIKHKMRSIYWSIYGSTIRNPAIPSNVRTILYVCKGNIVRSPFAEYHSNRLIAEKSESSKPLEFSSAGIIIPEIQASPEEAVITARQFDIGMQGHKPRLIDYSLIASVDMVVAMDVWQYKFLKKLFVEYNDKIFLLSLYDKEYKKHKDYYWKYNIVDPYGKGLDHYSDCYKRMSYVLRDFIDIILLSNRNT